MFFFSVVVKLSLTLFVNCAHARMQLLLDVNAFLSLYLLVTRRVTFCHCFVMKTVGISKNLSKRCRESPKNWPGFVVEFQMWAKSLGRSSGELSVSVTTPRYCAFFRFAFFHRTVKVGRDLWKSSGPTPLLEQGHQSFVLSTAA